MGPYHILLQYSKQMREQTAKVASDRKSHLHQWTGLKPEVCYTIPTPDRQQSKILLTIDKRGSKVARNSVLVAICRQSANKMAIVISNYF